MSMQEEEPQELPDEVLAEVNKIIEGSEDDKLVTVTLLGEDALTLLRDLYREVKVSADVKKYAEKWEKENLGDLGIDLSHKFLDPDNPESVQFNIYTQLVNQIPLGESGVPTEPRPDLPETVSLDITPRAIDILNERFVRRISDTSRMITGIQIPLGQKLYSIIVADTIGIFLKLNAEAIVAGVAPRPAYTQFIKDLQ